MNTEPQSSPQKYLSWLRLFLDTVNQHGMQEHVAEHEGYKFRSVNTFQSFFDIDATDLAGNLDKAIETNNLVIGAMYFPKKMLLIYALQYPDETREILRNLFDPSVDIAHRVNHTKVAFDLLEARRAAIEKSKKSNTFIGLRFISLLLSYYDPNMYNPLKPSEWKVFCKYIDPDFKIPHKTSAGEQYKIYNEYIEQLRSFIMTRNDITEIKEALTDGLNFKDDAYRWITQDVIFVTARAYAHKIAAEHSHNDSDDVQIIHQVLTPNVYQESDEDTGFMALEAHLEEYVVRNWDNIDFGEKISIYVEEDGTTGQQYTTDVGVMDILAQDDSGNFVVIELKRAESGFKVVGQILNYIGWVQENLATDGQTVRGLIIVGKSDKQLKMAIKPVAHMIALKEYRVTMQLKTPVL